MDGYTSQDGSNFQRGVVTVDIEFTAGTSGAVPALSAFARRWGVLSVVLSATGLYTVTLQQKYAAILNYTVNVLQSTYDATHGDKATVDADTITGQVIPFQVRATDGTAVALTSGDKIKITIRAQKFASDT